MPRTDINTLDDLRNEGFDDFFDGAPSKECWEIEGTRERLYWLSGWVAARTYRNALRGQTDE